MILTTEQSHSEWMASLKPGDQAVIHHWWDKIPCLVVVTRRTEANIWYSPAGSPDGHENRFARGDRVRLEPVTDKALAIINRQKLIDWFGNFDFGTVSTDKLLAAKHILESIK